MADQSEQAKLWTHRTVAETKDIYAKWADTYEADVGRMNYATPARIASALATFTDDKSAPVLDFGCGTGLSGMALTEAGFSQLDGTDISPEMLSQAGVKGVYRKLWLGTAGTLGAEVGAYGSIAATGVVSLGAAPPEMLQTLLDGVSPGGLLAFSYNDPTLSDAAYLAALDAVLESGQAEQLFREHGPHLSEKVTGSDVIVLRRL